MPVLFLDRLPLPSLQAYTAFSVLILSCSIYYAIQVTSQPEYSSNFTAATTSEFTKGDGSDESPPVVEQNPENLAGRGTNDTKNESFYVTTVIYFMIQEPLCIWTLINMAYCCLILIGKVIQKIVFGELRVSEQQHIKDKFWNFVFYKFIFIFGVINVQYMDEVVLWCSWFSVLGFLHLMAQLSKDRFEYLSFSPTTPRWTHIRLISLLFGIMATSSVLFVICILVGLNAGMNTFAFMAAECVLVNIRTLFVIVRYAIHLWDVNHEGVWENRGTYVYYTELIFELAALAVDFFHHIHMLLWGNIFLSMASLVILMQIRYMFYEMQRRFKKHKNYLRVVHHLENNYKMASSEELAANSDDCAICWDKMESARRLPCGHLFHNSCLLSWLEQDTSCPTCRTSLSAGGENNADNAENESPSSNNLLPGPLARPPIQNTGPANRTTTNHFFHFDASRYVSWLPSFSVEVTHTQLVMGRPQQIQTSQLDSMARQVQQMFTNMPLNLIVDDLRSTRSVEMTIENILDERLVPPPFQMQVSRTNATPEQPSEPSATSENQAGPDSTTKIEHSSSDVPAPDLPLEHSSPFASVTNAANEAFLKEQNFESNINTPVGGRFSKSPQERERMLATRKDELIRQAKRRYMSKLKCEPSESDEFNLPSTSGRSETTSSIENRRYLAYEAARRRLQNPNGDQ